MHYSVRAERIPEVVSSVLELAAGTHNSRLARQALKGSIIALDRAYATDEESRW